VKGPPVIQDRREIDETSTQCLEPLLALSPHYDGFLVACYADHTLTSILQARLAPKPVIGIFDASVTACNDVLAPGTQFGILTTGKAWEESLTAAVRSLLGVSSLASGAKVFAGVIATGITATVLKEKPTGIVKELLMTATKDLLSLGKVKVICLGGVILSNMRDWVMETCVLELGYPAAADIKIIEPVTTGTVALQNLILRGC
jgi:Asp/Glu/hydantoin racemase